MKNKVWIIPSLVVFVLLISSKDISSQEDKVVVHTPDGKVTITSSSPLEDCARVIQGSFEELNGLPETDVGGIDLNCFRPRPDCSVCCFGDVCKPKKCCQPNPCPRGPEKPAP